MFGVSEGEGWQVVLFWNVKKNEGWSSKPEEENRDFSGLFEKGVLIYSGVSSEMERWSRYFAGSVDEVPGEKTNMRGVWLITPLDVEGDGIASW